MREAEAAEEQAREATAQGARQGMLAEELRQALSQNQQLALQLEEISTQSIQVCRLSVLLPVLKQLMLQSDPAFPAVEELHGILFEYFLRWALAWCVGRFTHREMIGTTRQSAACQQSFYSRSSQEHHLMRS